jgi:hypothetical protein
MKAEQEDKRCVAASASSFALATVTSWAGHLAAQTATAASTRAAVARTRIGVFDSRSVFSTASIPNILQKLTNVLPKVAEEEGVSMIVSKWEVAFTSGDVDCRERRRRRSRWWNS